MFPLLKIIRFYAHLKGLCQKYYLSRASWEKFKINSISSKTLAKLNLSQDFLLSMTSLRVLHWWLTYALGCFWRHKFESGRKENFFFFLCINCHLSAERLKVSFNSFQKQILNVVSLFFLNNWEENFVERAKERKWERKSVKFSTMKNNIKEKLFFLSCAQFHFKSQIRLTSCVLNRKKKKIFSHILFILFLIFFSWFFISPI